MKSFAICILVIFGMFSMNANAQSQYCVFNISGASLNLPYPSNCFSTKWEAELQLRTEPAPEIGAQFLEPVDSGIGLSETNIKYEVKPKVAVFVGDVYWASPVAGFDKSCNSNPFTVAGVTGCGSEADLENDIHQGYPYYGTTTGEYVGAYSPSPPAVWEGMPLDATTNRAHVRVIKNTYPYSRSYHVFTNNGNFVNYSVWGAMDFYQCPRLFYGQSSTGSPFSPWPLVCGNTTQRSISVTSGQFNSCVKDGNPCVASTGNKEYRESDFDWEGESFKRAYNSIRDLPLASGLGDSWAHSFSERLSINSYISWIRGDGYFEGFTAVTATTYKSRNETGYMLTKEPDDVAAIKGRWRLESNSSKITWFNATGKLSRVEYSDGKILTFNYCSDVEFTAGACNNRGGLTRVTSGTGRTLDFYYANIDIVVNLAGDTRKEPRISSIKGNGTTVVSYTYNNIGQLTSVLYGDNGLIQGRQYLYAESAYLCKDRNGNAIASCNSAYFPYHLTGVIDEKNVRYATYTYDQLGRVTSSKHANDAGITRLNYLSATSVEVTLATGAKKIYTTDTSLFKKPTNLAFFDSNGVSTSNSSSIYVDMRLSNRTEANGYKTIYGYNNFQQISKTEALTSTGARTPQSRTHQSDWHPSLNLPTERRLYNSSVATPGVLESRTTTTYNTRGQATAMCQIDPTNTTAMAYVCGSSTNAPVGVRQSTTTYCEAADITAGTCPLIGLAIANNGPRTDVSDISTFTYYQTDDATCATAPTTCPHRKGDLWKVTNALNQTSETLAYDGAGRALQMKDANNVITDMEYQARGWLTARKVRGSDNASEADDAITRMEYDATGQVTKVIQADGDFVSFNYDAAHRLTSISDALNNSITYTLDNAGNRTAETTKDLSNTVKRSLSRVYDTLGRLQASKNAASATLATLTYDANDNLNTTTDGLSRVTDQDVDPLNRLIKTIQDQGAGKINATTQFEYDARDNLTKVIDPKSLNTVYTYNGLNDLTALSSPDTGSTLYTYDSAGNRKTQTDARNKTSTYGYDVANRLTSVSVPTAAQNVTFDYDATQADCQVGETFTAGRMARITDESGSTRYCYNRLGQPVRKVQSITSGPSLTLGSTYNAANRMVAMTYPSGAIVTYLRNAKGQITGVDAKPTAVGAQVSMVSNATYLPFGPLNTLTFGNGRILTKAYDQNYDIDKVSDNSTTGLSQDSTVNVMGNITAITERTNATANATRQFAYDNIDRLLSLKNGATNVQSFTYDATGNRLNKTLGTTVTTNTLDASSHRLTQTGTTARSYDANGNTATIGAKAYVYDDRNRLRDYKNSGTSVTRTYRYNGKGERVSKVVSAGNASNRYYFYDEAGHLLGEYLANGTRVQEYVWLDDQLVAVLSDHDASTYQFVETDHLGTPRAVVHPVENNIVWRWNITNTAFGEHAATNNPDGDAVTFGFNLRYPGQLYDVESGLHQNGFRDYEPGGGRYVESDPIGLGGGVSTYGYVFASPLTSVDPSGLKARLVDIPPSNARPLGSIYCVNGVIKPAYMWSSWPKDYSSCADVRDCVDVHEMSHVSDANRSSPGLCKKPWYGWLIEPVPMSVTFSNDIAPLSGLSELDVSELNAHAAELSCLARKLRAMTAQGKDCDSNCRKAVLRRIKQITGQAIPSIYDGTYGQ